MKRTSFLLLFLFTGLFHSKSAEVDSILVWKVDSLNHISEKNEFENHQLAKQTAIEALNLSKAANYQYGMAYSMSSLGKVYLNQSSFDTAHYLFEQCLRLDSISNDAQGFLVDYGNMALLHKYQGDYEKAVSYDLKALEIAEEKGYDLYAAYIYNNIGNSYKYLEDPVKAIESYQSAMDIWLVQSEEQQNLGMVFMNISILYSENPELIPEDEPNIVLRSLDRADEYFSNSNDQYNLHDSKIHRAGILIRENRAQEALILARESEVFFTENENTYKLCDAKNFVAHALSALGKHAKAIKKIDESIQIMETHEIGGEVKLNAFFAKSDFLRRNGQFQASNTVLTEAYSFKDSLMDTDLKSRINEIQAQYDLSQERANVLELEKLNQQKEFESKQLQNWIIILILSSLFIVLIIVVFSRYKLHKSKLQLSEYQKNLLEEKQQISSLNLRLLASQMNPHFTKNALYAIQSLIKKNEVKKSDEYLSTFARLQRNILENASNNTISLGDELQLIEDYVKVEQLRQDQSFDLKLKIDDDLDSEYDRIPSMILQPIIENAIIHGLFHKRDQGLLSIHLRKITHANQEGLYCEIQDNGVGRDFTLKLKNGNRSQGIEIVKKRLEILSDSSGLKCQLSVEDLYDSADNSSGTLVKITLPFL
ncbi:MAG: tetratricopeptide repeat protein [Flavobacteriales bacterium]|nr:tetratricopeptide repeat protein [Flavobacteriales bacterium]